MKLTDRYNGSNDPFEGDLTLQWRSLPVNALVAKATLKATPTNASNGTLFQEVITFANGQGNLGATKNLRTEVDFHKRRTLYSVAGSNLTNANLQVDLGGVYVEISSKGAIKTPSDNPFALPADGTLPGLTVSKFKLSPPAGTSDVQSVTVRSFPTNLTVRLGNMPPFWTRLGELSTAETSPDFTSILQTFLSKAGKENGFYRIPLVLHSDNVCRLNLDLEVEYVIQASLQPVGVKEVVLPYDYSTTPKTSSGVLSLVLPATAQVVPGGTTASVKGAFEETRIVYGPTGSVTPADSASVSPSVSQAQMLSLDTALGATGIDLLLTAVSRTARLSLDLRGDLDGKPDRSSLLPSPVEFTVDGTVAGHPTWISVSLPAEFHFQNLTQKRYWVVLQCLDGEAGWGVQPAAGGAAPLQHTLDGGLSWRNAPSSKIPGALAAFLRLRDTPERFQVPVELQVGVGAQAVRVKLDRFQPLGRVDFALDASDMARAFNEYSAQAASAALPEGEQLANGNFSQWSVTGNDVGAPFSIPLQVSPQGIAVAPDGRWAYVAGVTSEGTTLLSIVSVMCDEIKASLPLSKLQGDTPQALAVHPDGSRVYILGRSALGLVDAVTWTEIGTLPLSALSDFKLNTDQTFGPGLAVGPDGSQIYMTTGNPTIIGLDTGKLEQAALGRATLTAGDVTAIPVSSPAAEIALAPAGNRLYATVPATNKITVIDLASGQTFDIPTGPQPSVVALTPDGSMAVVGNAGDNTLSLIDTVGRQSSSIKVAGQPVGIAISSDGARAFVATQGSASAKTVNSVNVVDLDRRAVQGTPVPLAAAPSSVAITPQGDRVYVAVVSATGATTPGTPGSNALVLIPVGVRQPAEWSLTSGQIVLACISDVSPPALAVGFAHRMDSRFVANATATALSQVIPVAASSNYAFSFKGLATDSGAVAEVFWLGQNCKSVRTDAVPIRVLQSTRGGPRLATHSARLIAPAGAVQAEVRFSAPQGVVAAIAETSLSATSEAVANGDLQSRDEHGGLSQWSQVAQGTSPLLSTVGGATVLKNPASMTAELVQALALSAGKPFTLQFEGRAAPLASTENNPSLEVRYLAKDGSAAGSSLNLAIGSRDFEQHAASGTVPDGSVQVELHLILPPGTALGVNQISLRAQDLASIPLTFLSQAPGELRVSGANVAYAEAPARPMPVPANGLCTPTAPGSKPGDPPCGTCFCPCCQDQQTVTQPAAAVTTAGRPVTVGQCSNCGSQVVRGGGAVVSGAPILAQPMLPVASPLPAAAVIAQATPVMPSLTGISGIGKGRLQQLANVGIKSVAGLAAAAPEAVAHAMRGVSVTNATVYIERARRLLQSFEELHSVGANLFASQP